VTDMTQMFWNTTSFNISSLGSWVLNNPNMYRFFSENYSIEVFTELLYQWIQSNGGTAPAIISGISVNASQQANRIAYGKNLQTAYSTAGTVFKEPGGNIVNIWGQLYNIIYDLDGGTGTKPTQISLTTGSTFTVASADGITPPSSRKFAGWSDGTNVYETGSTYTVGEIDIVFYAVWNYNG